MLLSGARLDAARPFKKLKGYDMRKWGVRTENCLRTRRYQRAGQMADHLKKGIAKIDGVKTGKGASAKP